MQEISLQQIFALIPTTVNRYLDFALDILLQTLRNIPEGAIHFSDHNEIIKDNVLIRACHSKLTGGFGSIDGLSLPCQEADDPEVENATYNGWKSSHFISNVLVFSPQGEFECDLHVVSLYYYIFRCHHICSTQCSWKLA